MIRCDAKSVIDYLAPICNFIVTVCKIKTYSPKNGYNDRIDSADTKNLENVLSVAILINCIRKATDRTSFAKPRQHRTEYDDDEEEEAVESQRIARVCLTFTE